MSSGCRRCRPATDVALADQQIAAFLADIASTEPAPGAGSAAGVALALGLACARKAIVLTLRHHPDASALAAFGTHLDGLSDQAIAGAEADMRCFTAYIEAVRRPKDDPERASGERDALADLVAVGENLIAIGDEARRKLLEVKADVYPATINDVAAALALIAAARAVHAACVAESVRALAPLNP